MGAAAQALPRAVLLVGAVALLWLPTWAHGDPQDRKSGKSPKTERLPTPVKTTTPQAEPSPRPEARPPMPDKPAAEGGVVAMGSVQLVRSLTLSPAVAGRVVNVHVDIGSTVKKSDLLVELDANRAKLELERAHAKYQTLKDKFEMVAQMVKAAQAPQSEGKVAEMEYRVAQADVQLAELALQGTRIVAPIDGTVLRWRAQIGQNVTAGQSLGELANLRRVEAVVQLPPRDVNRLGVGRRCRVNVQDTDDTYQGSIGRIDPFVDSASGTIKVYVTIDAPEKGDLPRPGSFVRVEFAPKE
jgi:multidrug efflux system membrane fusion protein